MEHYLEDLKDNYNNYNDSAEEYIFDYINHIETFIQEYGYNKIIATVSENSSIKDIEDTVRNFLISKANSWNHLEIFGTLKKYPDKDIYVCCYEPYGEEVLCIENKSNSLFFFDISDYKNGIKKSDINFFSQDK